MISFSELIHVHHWQAKKSLGQNFLHSIDQARKIVNKAGIVHGQHIFEIGSGSGVLSKALLERAKCLVSLEIDQQLHQLLKDRYEMAKLHWLLGNALNFDFKQLLKIAACQWHVVSNLPYATATKILFRLLESDQIFSQATLMFQKEVALRLLAKEGNRDYGALTICANYYAEIERIVAVKPANFLPQPKVESLVLQFTLRSKRLYRGKKEKEYLNFVHQIFHYRRKQLQNIIRTEKNFNYSIEQLTNAFEQCSIDLKRRPETLNSKELEEVFDKLES